MARHRGLPRPEAVSLRKSWILEKLTALDADEEATRRVLGLELAFRDRITQHIDALPSQDARFDRFNTNPFVLMFYCKQKGFSNISQIEQSILPAKVFMSMETSAGRMVEAVALPAYSWEIVPSEMDSPYSVVDGKRLDQECGVLRLATLKSGPRCLNDPTTKAIADDIIENCTTWATEAGVSDIEFTYGVLYGTKKQSNKKDWHILRNLNEKLPSGSVSIDPTDKWYCEFKVADLRVRVTVRVGMELWDYVAGHDMAFFEVASALIRACVAPPTTEAPDYDFTISDLQDVISLDRVPEDFNVSILQRSQLEWLFFFARHFCDELLE